MSVKHRGWSLHEAESDTKAAVVVYFVVFWLSSLCDFYTEQCAAVAGSVCSRCWLLCHTLWSTVVVEVMILINW